MIRTIDNMGDIAVVSGNNNTLVCFKNCIPFTRGVTHLNDEHVASADNLDLIIELYNLTEYSDNYSGSTGTLFQFKKNEQNLDAARNIDNVNANDSSPFKYKSNLLKRLTTRDVTANVNTDIANAHRVFLNAQIVFH